MSNSGVSRAPSPLSEQEDIVNRSESSLTFQTDIEWSSGNKGLGVELGPLIPESGPSDVQISGRRRSLEGDGPALEYDWLRPPGF
eukprot:1185932-Prorocentrum_minimum.AAC.2